MIKSKKNVLIMAENHGGVEPWYQAGYDRILQDTDYKFTSLDALQRPAACMLNRGKAGAPMLLVNHWVDTGVPSPSAAGDANDMKVLDQRMKSCEKQWKRKPNIIAVDFYAKGDLMREVDHLNGVDGPPTVLAAAAR
jgi:hypothetical protein